MMVGRFELLFLLALLLVVVIPTALALAALWFYLARRAPGRQSPLDIARERYARGEIDRDQFEQIRRDLEAAGQSEPRPRL